ncbi:MAG: histidine kinase dimerization/phospho-acceptor domain-containing protein, partial [Pseudomonadota bacterium]|nr:histidine kinase dimerization/phospho-acceptor domain-containing protein [Pseudomonadota bacterium]
MGRLFWKIFLPIWLAQIIGTMSVMLILRLEGAPPAQHRPPATEPAPSGMALAPSALQGAPRHSPSMLPPEPLVAHLLASLLVAALLAQYLSRPIRSLRDAIRHAAAGNLEPAIDHRVANRNDELSDLLTEFDRMARQLHAVMESQRHLLHDVSHEVRAPLARMPAALGLARQQPHRADAMLDRIERETGRVDHLVEELLTLARLEAQQSGSLEHQVCIDTLLADIMDSAL